jgi:hypothetical protein
MWCGGCNLGDDFIGLIHLIVSHVAQKTGHGEKTGYGTREVVAIRLVVVLQMGHRFTLTDCILCF